MVQLCFNQEVMLVLDFVSLNGDIFHSVDQQYIGQTVFDGLVDVRTMYILGGTFGATGRINAGTFITQPPGTLYITAFTYRTAVVYVGGQSKIGNLTITGPFL